MATDPTATVALLQRWHSGDVHALHELLQRDLPWIRERVALRIGPLLEGKADVDDYVQDAMVRVLQYGPKFTLSDRAAFRGMMARLIENLLRDRLDYHQAQRRSVAKERPLPSDTVLNLDPPRDSVARPSVIARRNEDATWLHLAIDLLDADDRELILLRQSEGLSFEAIGQQLGVPAGTIRMRFHRALRKLSERLRSLRRGNLHDLAG